MGFDSVKIRVQRYLPQIIEFRVPDERDEHLTQTQFRITPDAVEIPPKEMDTKQAQQEQYNTIKKGSELRNF